MTSRVKRTASALSAAAIAASLIPLLSAAPASAAPIDAGNAVLSTPAGVALAGGDSNTDFTLKLPVTAACSGDSANDSFTVYSYLVPASVAPADMAFDSNGPVVPAGAGMATSLLTPDGELYLAAATAPASPAPGPGPVINIPVFDFAHLPVGYVPAGAYNVGIACVKGGQPFEYWNTTMTITDDPTGGPAQMRWAAGIVAPAPTINSVTPGDQQLTVDFTDNNPSGNAAVTGFTVTATPQGGGAPVVANGTASPIVVTGLTNGTVYDIEVTATNSVGTGPAATSTGTPNPGVRNGVSNLQVAPGVGEVSLSWNAPTDHVPTGYDVQVLVDADGSPAAGAAVVVNGTTADITGLTAGTVYRFVVTPQHPAPYVAASAQVTSTVFDSQILVQGVDVTRPNGALVLTQECGVNAEFAADPTAITGFPNGLPAIPAATAGTAPTLTLGGTDADPHFPDYPYPTDANGDPIANYPTHCGVDLGAGKLVTKGAGAGQFFATTGVLHQVTVVDTRDTDTGWTANGTMGDFNAGTGKTFSGSQLGWIPAMTSDSDAFADSTGFVYDQTVVAGGAVAPNSPVATGLTNGATLGTAGAGEGLGIAKLDARLQLLIPIHAKSGNYTGLLTISAI